jgi:drug/metabolite transporter (DMT)-like permease
MSPSSLVANLSVLVSEAFLALFPQVIKQNELATIQLQTLIRVLTITAAAWVYVRYIEKRNTWNISFKSGFVNSLHIVSSYTAFQNLDSSDALTIFYSYPLWNIILTRLLLNEPIDPQRVPIILLSVIGVALILQPNMRATPRQKFGIVAALVAALTESYLYITFHDKTDTDTPAERLLGQYTGTVPFVLLWAIIAHKFFKKELSHTQEETLVFQIFIFNLLIGFGMHLMRAYGALNARPESFAVLSTAGVLFGFLFQVLFEKKMPSTPKIIGGLLIVAAGVTAGYMDAHEPLSNVVDEIPQLE